MNKAYWKNWVKSALIRAVRTIAQTLTATIGTTTIFAEIDWKLVLTTSALSGILSILTSLTGLPEVQAEDENGVENATEDDIIV